AVRRQRRVPDLSPHQRQRLAPWSGFERRGRDSTEAGAADLVDRSERDNPAGQPLLSGDDNQRDDNHRALDESGQLLGAVARLVGTAGVGAAVDAPRSRFSQDVADAVVSRQAQSAGARGSGRVPAHVERVESMTRRRSAGWVAGALVAALVVGG